MKNPACRQDLLDSGPSLDRIVPNGRAYLSDSELRELERGSDDLEPQTVPLKSRHDEKSFSLSLERLLSMAEEPRLPNNRRTAVNNALCGALERGAASPSNILHKECFNLETWNRVLAIYLVRSGDAQAKSAKHLLSMLVKYLEIRTGSEETKVLEYEATRRCVSLVFGEEQLSSVKAAMRVLEKLLLRRIIDGRMITTLSSPSSVKVETGNEDLVDGKVAAFDTTTPCVHLYDNVRIFLDRMFVLARRVELSAIAGRLLATFLGSFHMDNASGSCHRIVPAKLPASIWCQSIRKALKEYPPIMEILEHHVLPDLLRLDKVDTLSFARSLPLKNMVEGAFLCLSETDIRLCLAVVREMEKDGAISSLSMSRV